MHKRLKSLLAASALTVLCATSAQADTDPKLGQIIMIGMDWCPRDYIQLNGQLLPISANPALFSLLGDRFGGDLQTVFGVPDLRGRSPMGDSSLYTTGTHDGWETMTLFHGNLPSHSHHFYATDQFGSSMSGANHLFAEPVGGNSGVYVDVPPGSTNLVPMSSSVITPTGNSQAFAISQPSQVINFCMSTGGYYPSRN